MTINNNGLSNKEVERQRKKYGSNEINVAKKNKFLNILISSLSDPIIKILLIALGIKVIFLIKDFDWYETIGILVAIFVASFISSISEYGSEEAFIKMQNEASKIKCKVKRNGVVSESYINDIVVDDLVILQTGDRIPADGYLIDGKLSIDESSLNGETKEVYKESLSAWKNTVSDYNKVYRGTVAYSGNATMIVTSVGEKTLYGKIALELEEEQPVGPLKTRLTNLAKIISRVGYVASFLVCISYLFSVIVIKNNFDINLMCNGLLPG